MPTPCRIPFVATRFVDAPPKQHDVERRLKDFLLSLRDDGWTPVLPEAAAELMDRFDASAAAAEDRERLKALYRLSGVYDLAHRRRKHFIREADEEKIARRARRYVECVAASTGLGHLAKEDIQRLRVLRMAARSSPFRPITVRTRSRRRCTRTCPGWGRPRRRSGTRCGLPCARVRRDSASRRCSSSDRRVSASPTGRGRSAGSSDYL